MSTGVAGAHEYLAGVGFVRRATPNDDMSPFQRLFGARPLLLRGIAFVDAGLSMLN
jgi:hypothetical protein